MLLLDPFFFNLYLSRVPFYRPMYLLRLRITRHLSRNTFHVDFMRLLFLFYINANSELRGYDL